MKKIKFLAIIVLILSSGGLIKSQIGTWRSHLPYSSATKVVVAGNKIFCATNGGLFYYNQSDRSIEKFSKENGLSDTEVSALGYSADLGITIIAYMNANIDLIQNNTIYNIPDIIRNTQILGDKRIYSIMIRDKFAYLSTGFGIVVLNLEAKEITETYKIGEGGAQIKVNEMCFDGSFLYAATDQGIYKADINAPNLQYYIYWTRVTEIPNYNLKFNSITSVNGRVYASYQSGTADGDRIYCKDGETWFNFTDNMVRSPGEANDNSYHLSAWDDNLVISGRFHVDVFTRTGERIKHRYTGAPRNAFFDNNAVLWVADIESGLIQNPDESTNILLIPDGPSSTLVSDIAISENRLYTVQGGLSSSLNNLFLSGTVNSFQENDWKSYKKSDYLDFYRIAIDPVDPEHYFIASWGWGLIEFQKDSVIAQYKDGNSPLKTIIPGNYCRLGGLCFDKSGNLWVSSSGVENPVSVLLKNGQWVSFDLDNLIGGYYTGGITNAQSGFKWLIISNLSRGIVIIDDNRTIENLDDDRYLKLDVKDEYNSIITNDVYCISEDREGNVWLGTNKGVLVYYNPSGAFDDENFYAQQIIIPRNDGTNLGDALLGTESVTAIATDGANRKWLGTKNAGVSLVSDDGLTQIHNFNSENSPLLSNSITSIAIDDKTGEVFFGTDKGIISYRASATGPSENYESVYVYPNPVRESFTGDIAITGLLENTTVKITDLNGNLVFETVSLGGQAMWDGQNFSGERVSTGVYLVFCSNEDGTLSHVTKLLFIH